MSIKRSQLIDADQSVFSVLDVVTVQLFSGYHWQGEDFSDPTAEGSTFYAFEDPPTKAVAWITIADVTRDESEPDISSLEESEILAIDASLRAAVEAQMQVVNWMHSKLNVSDTTKALVTPYIIESDGTRWQYIGLRTSHRQKKYIVMGTFDVGRSDPLAQLVFHAMRSVDFK